MSTYMGLARELLTEFKNNNYAFGSGALNELGPMAKELGKTALVAGPMAESWFQPILETVKSELEASGVKVIGIAKGGRPNAPREDVYRLEAQILHSNPDMVIAVDSGSGIDVCKAAAILTTFGDIHPEIDHYFGAGQVSKLCKETGRSVLPVLACMTAASSAAHLTKYSNITDPANGQKKLIIDDAMVPPKAVFDYDLTASQPQSLTLDGGLDGISHCMEVYLGAKEENLTKIEEVCLCGIDLIISGFAEMADDEKNLEAREKIAIGTDLGGYAIMLGGTNGPHLNSFSLVKYLTHGRACAILLPYYTVFFSPAVEDRVRKTGSVYKKFGFIDEDLGLLSGSELGKVVAKGMMAFNESIGFPTRLSEVNGIEKSALTKTLQAAQDPQLESKLQNMPIPLKADSVEKLMGSVLNAAWDGDLSKIIV